MRVRLGALALFLATAASSSLTAAPGADTNANAFRAGAYVVDISPTQFPVIVNAMFTERSASAVVDPLFAKALVLDDGRTRIALCVVDSCMVPRDLIDRAKELAARRTGIPLNRMMVSSTHTHSAPSAMGCLGSRADTNYAGSLPAKIADAITGAAGRLEPAKVAWTAVDDWDHTFNRRWIRRPDKILTDPFGQPTVRANMHPGYQSPEVIGPSGPVDPTLTFLAVAAMNGRPLAVFANYSQHYYGSPLLSSDYYGRFSAHLANTLRADSNFVAIMSQGTSGDQMWMDYGAAPREIGYDAYASAIATRVSEAYGRLQWRNSALLGMGERKLVLRYRVPDEARLTWARRITEALGVKLPMSHAEIYAWEAIYLHQRQQTELKLQALRIGDLGITAIPNEVYALTGLKLKKQSPFSLTMNVSLANGAEGYIPPPEQHKLGGYTTWPARTAGLEVQAEPRIVDALLGLLEEVAGKQRRQLVDEEGPYSRAVFKSRPMAYWRLNEMSISRARDATGNGHDASIEDGVALFLPGPGSGTGVTPIPALQPSNFSGPQINRAMHFAGGRLRARNFVSDVYTVEFWLWNGLDVNARPVTGYLFSRGLNADRGAAGEHLGIGGSFRSEVAGKLFLSHGEQRVEGLAGRSPLAPRAWHHVVFVRDGNRVRVHLDGRAEPEIEGVFDSTLRSGGNELFFGGSNVGDFGLEGRLDEIVIYDRPLGAGEIRQHYEASGLKPPATPE
jgi:hypothetical protein